MEKGRKRRQYLLRTLMPGLSLVERGRTNTTQGGDLETCGIKFGTGQILDQSRIRKKREVKEW